MRCRRANGSRSSISGGASARRVSAGLWPTTGRRYASRRQVPRQSQRRLADAGHDTAMV